MKIRESDGLLSISGTYDEMRSLVPPLKSLGFKWDGQVWSIPVSALTPAKKERVDAMTSGPLRAQQEMVQKVQDSWAHVKEDMSKLFSLAFEEKPKGILITGIPRDMDHIVKRVGGAGLENGYFISWSGVRDTKALDQFWENLKDLSQKRRKAYEDIVDLVGKGRSWSTLDVRVALKGNWVVVSGNTRPFKDAIRRILDWVRWDPNLGWIVPVLSTNEKHLITLFSFLDVEESKASVQLQQTPSPREDSKQSPPSLNRPNQRAQECDRCGEIVPPGKGWLVKDFDDDDNSMWIVVHKDQSHCDQVINEKKNRFLEDSAKRVSIRDAQRRLRAIADRDGEWIPGPHRLKGDPIYLGGALHGGGDWVVLDGDYVWYVTNNGSDGDDWSLNNVETGGAGAIGRRLRLTPEIQEIIALAS